VSSGFDDDDDDDDDGDDDGCKLNDLTGGDEWEDLRGADRQTVSDTTVMIRIAGLDMRRSSMHRAAQWSLSG